MTGRTAPRLIDLLGSEVSRTGLSGDWYRVDIPGNPVAKGRPKASVRCGRVQMRTPEPTQRGEAWVRHCWMQEHGQTLLAGALQVRITMRVTIPASWSKSKQHAAIAGLIQPIGKPDLDNAAKLILDALNGIAWFDDAQVVRLDVSKWYAVPGVGAGVMLSVREYKAEAAAGARGSAGRMGAAQGPV
ncbi:RusA family crossover junction endodeoxyribonuclease [Pseudomonas sp. PDM21]|nr:RusA family crossover junction endodeoxyribonuclease [Pseudomonas sp. PDM21]